VDISASIPRATSVAALPLLQRLTYTRAVRRTANGGRLRGAPPASDRPRCLVPGCRSVVTLPAGKENGLRVCVRCREELAAVLRTPVAVPRAV
jgi:hypothetical protein